MPNLDWLRLLFDFRSSFIIGSLIVCLLQTLLSVMAFATAPGGEWEDEVLLGTADASRTLRFARSDEARLVLRRELSPSCVALLSGGGSGHEPAHAGFVGSGMLSAAVCGYVFASPSAAAVLAALTEVTREAGALLIVKSYTGDRLSFGLAAERARARGLRVETCLVGDDVALPHNPVAGRRGLAGTLLVHKVAGAAAEAGLPLSAVAAEAAETAANLATVNLISAVCALPGAQRSTRLPAGQCELGAGIHGEPGASVVPLGSTRDSVDAVFGRLMRNEHLCISEGQRVAMLVNGMGGTSPGELALLASAALAAARCRSLRVMRLIVGSLMTSLDARGFSITLLRLDDLTFDALARLDAPTEALAWPRSIGHPEDTALCELSLPTQQAPSPQPPRGELSARAARLLLSLQRAASALVALEATLDEADAICGDGDCGKSLAGGARAVLADCEAYDCEYAAALLGGLVASIRRSVGGSIGVLLDILFSAAEASARDASDDNEPSLILLTSLEAGIAAVSRHGGAGEGDRTMLDAMLPACRAARGALDAGCDGWAAVRAAAEAAERGAAATRAMRPRAGRSSYQAGGRLEGTADPGATAVAALLRAAAS
jgi:dihydroxyacetone kinase